MDNFFRTRMGMTFFEGTLPRLVVELKRLNDNLEADRKERAERATVKERANGHSEFMCPGCGCEPGDGRTDGCTHPRGCGR